MAYTISEIKVPAENPFQYDRLEREPVVEFLAKLIGRLNGPFVMALNSSFGNGKTTLVRMLIQYLENQNHRCIYFNAWKVDYATDPLVALVAKIDHDILKINIHKDGENVIRNQELKKITTDLTKSSAINAIKALTYGVIDLNVISKTKSQASQFDVVTKFNEDSQLSDKFRDVLDKAIKSLLQNENCNSDNLIFFIDELDRCRPTYAIQLLERIKHLFDIPNVVFVLSIDKKQIEACIKSVYGAEIDAAEYLRRFFNLEYGIPVSDTHRYIDSLIERFGLDPIFAERKSELIESDRKNFVECFHLLTHALNLSLRAIERCITRLKVVMDQTANNQILYPILVAVLLVLHSKQPDYFEKIIHDDLPPEAAMDYLKPLINAKTDQQNYPLERLHAYLLMADPDRERADKRYGELKILSQENNDQYVKRVIEYWSAVTNKHLFCAGSSYVSLTEIAKKVDLTAWIK